MKKVKWLPKLETLTLRVFHDIMPSDLKCIRSIIRYQGKTKIVLKIATASFRDDPDGKRDRLIRISAAAVKVFHDCGWELVGGFEKIDEEHHFRDEVLWHEWLEYYRDRSEDSVERIELAREE